ncbi:MAG: hypothetical protein IJV37_07960 [Bacteroidales bacterium]|nr:hypothetical protein [Bacteroidales bacterium]
MKKRFLILLLALVPLAASAQRSDLGDNRLILVTNGTGTVDFAVLGHVGYGFHIVTQSEFEPRGVLCGELFVNLVKLSLAPLDNLGVDLGIDFKYNHFNAKKAAFMLDAEHKVQAVPFADFAGGDVSRNSARINILGFSAPLLVKGVISGLAVGIGAEVGLNVWGSVRDSYQLGERRYSVMEPNARVSTFTYGFIADVSFYGLSIYAKFYPRSMRTLQEGSTALHYWTIGVAFGF